MADLERFYDDRYQSGYMGDFVKGNYDFRRSERVKYIIHKLHLSKRNRILDYGCGQGKYTGVLETLFPNTDINGCDISKVAIEKAKARFPKFQFAQFSDVAPYKNNTFDFVLSIEVFEHVADITKTINDISRILKPGGYLVFTTPCANALSLEHLISALRRNGIQPSKDGFRRFYFEDAGHIRRLKSKEISKILNDSGMAKTTFFFDCQFFGGLQWMYGDMIRSIPKSLKKIKGIKKLAAICLIPFLPFVYLLDLLAWLEWVLFKKFPNGSGMFGISVKS
jgi:SAM-dependent methyltransferase